MNYDQDSIGCEVWFDVIESDEELHNFYYWGRMFYKIGSLADYTMDRKSLTELEQDATQPEDNSSRDRA